MCNSRAQTQLLALGRWTHIWNIIHHEEPFPIQQRMEQAIHDQAHAQGTAPRHKQGKQEKVERDKSFVK